MRAVVILLLFLIGWPALAQEPDMAAEEAAIRAVVATWYAELRKPVKRSHWMLYAANAIDGGPAETELFPDQRARSPTISNELAARALEFAYDIDAIRADASFAKVNVWERGYFHAWANHETYELAAAAVFVMEKQPDGRWLILAHKASSVGIPDSKRTDPLPDLSGHWKVRKGDLRRWFDGGRAPR